MDTRFVEATNGFNHGKFLLGRYNEPEMAEHCRVGGEFGQYSVIRSQGFTRRDIWILDLATGEGAIFPLSGSGSADVHKRRIRVCPLYEPFVVWLYDYVAKTPDWWNALPRLVALPDAPSALHGHRRTGTSDGTPA